jgi:hypothetical protein
MSYEAPPPPPPPPGGYGAQPAYGGPAGPPPNNFLVPAILATIFCCLPAGVVGIVFAAQVNSKWAVGDVAGAQSAAAKARTWTFVSVGVGLVVVVGWLLLVGLAALSGSSS